MRKTDFVHTYFCDLCGEQVTEEILSTVYGEEPHDSSRGACYHFGVDICLGCQRKPIADLLDLLRNTC